MILITVLFLAASAWLYFAPATKGRMEGVLRTEDGLTVLGMAAFTISVLFAASALTYAVRSLFGLPALSYDDVCLSSYVFPFQRIALEDIERLTVGENDIEVHTKQQRKRKLNVRLVYDHQTFFEKLCSQHRITARRVGSSFGGQMSG